MDEARPGVDAESGAAPSDSWLINRARELMAIAQRSELEQRSAAVAEADELLAEARNGRDPRIVAAVMRAATIIRLVTPGHLDEVQPLFDEMLEHTKRHDLVVTEADTYALRANHIFRNDPENDAVLDELANALAILEEDLPEDPVLSKEDAANQLARALSDAGIVFHHMDIHELADVLLARAQQQLLVAGESHDMIVLLFNRVRSLLLWGLQLERTGQNGDAGSRFATASEIATEAEKHWQNNIFPDRRDQTAADQVVAFGVSHALHRPGGEHLERLSRLRERSDFPDDPVLLDIAHARCLRSVGRRDEALDLLQKHPFDQDPVDRSEPALRLSLVREIAQLHETTGTPAGAAWHGYATALEAGLLSLQRARMSALRSRIEHAKLRRQHGMLTRQALQDPLTGLPNRRALEQQLQRLITVGSGGPLSVAMLDLDGFKQVNDRHTHVIGDNVLRVIARTLREVLRSDDLVARFGGDEFVVLLPSTSLHTAMAALSRAVSAVTALPRSLARGVTVSVGVTMVRSGDDTGGVLARADAAMYQAKRGGGGQVFAHAYELAPTPRSGG